MRYALCVMQDEESNFLDYYMDEVLSKEEAADKNYLEFPPRHNQPEKEKNPVALPQENESFVEIIDEVDAVLAEKEEDEIIPAPPISSVSGELNLSEEKIILIRKLIKNILSNAEQLEAFLGEDKIFENIFKRPALQSSEINAQDDYAQSGDKIIEGIFDGEKMIGPDGQIYSVPANYASKSRLVEGDTLKLIITNRGAFIFKQIKLLLSKVPCRSAILDLDFKIHFLHAPLVKTNALVRTPKGARI